MSLFPFSLGDTTPRQELKQTLVFLVTASVFHNLDCDKNQSYEGDL